MFKKLLAVLLLCSGISYGADYFSYINPINPTFTTLTVSGQSTLGKTVIGAYDFNLGISGSSFTFHVPNSGNSVQIEGSSVANLLLSRTSGWDNFIRSNGANLELGLSKDEFVTFPVQMRFNYAPSIQFMPSWTDAVMSTWTANGLEISGDVSATGTAKSSYAVITGSITTGSITSTGYLRPGGASTATLKTSTPLVIGAMYYNTDTKALYISTGATQYGYGKISYGATD